MTTELPEYLVRYLEQRDAERTAAVRNVLASLTDRERALVRDTAVMGYVRGTLNGRYGGEDVPKDAAIVAEVVDGCLANPDLYPAINPPPGDEPVTDAA